MYCRQCGEELTNPKAVICVKCGTNKGQGNNYCPECGQEVRNTEAEVCLSCGVRLKGSVNNFTNQIKSGVNKSSGSNSNDNNKMVAGLLAVFLGALGIHRFYLGYKEVGFIQLGICILGMFVFAPITFVSYAWAIYDAVQIFTGKLDNANGETLV